MKNRIRPLTEQEIEAGCKSAYERFMADPRTIGARAAVKHEIIECVHSVGYHDGGAFTSEHDGECLEILLAAAERCLAHFDKIRLPDREPSAMVEQLREAINDARCRGKVVARG